MDNQGKCGRNSLALFLSSVAHEFKAKGWTTVLLIHKYVLRICCYRPLLLHLKLLLHCEMLLHRNYQRPWVLFHETIVEKHELFVGGQRI